MFGIMIVPRFVLVLSALFLMRGSSLSQAVDSTGGTASPVQKMYTGFTESLAWYDLPIAAADIAELVFVSPTAADKPVRFPATDFDVRFQDHVGGHGSPTLIGRTGDLGWLAFFGVRFLANVGSDLAGGNVTPEDYHRTFWFYKSIVYTYSLTALTKSLVYRLRPDGSDGESFFSGHSSTAFCAALYLSLELNTWYDRWEPTRSDRTLRSTLKIGTDVALYAGATYVAYSRLHDEKHYFTDVAVGAAIGTVMGTVMYHWQWNPSASSHQDVSFAVVHKTPFIRYTLQF